MVLKFQSYFKNKFKKKLLSEKFQKLHLPNVIIKNNFLLKIRGAAISVDISIFLLMTFTFFYWYFFAWEADTWDGKKRKLLRFNKKNEDDSIFVLEMRFL